MPFDLWIRRTLWTGAILTGVLSLAGVLCLTFRAVGDETAAAGVLGVLFVAALGWGVDFVALVVLLALARLDENAPPRDGPRS